MPYDVALADRIRDLLAAEPDVSERRMFGGLAFLASGAMAIAASGEGGALVRVDPADGQRLVDTTTAQFAVMRGRPMPGWLRVPSEDLATARQLAAWVRRGVAYARAVAEPPERPV